MDNDKLLRLFKLTGTAKAAPSADGPAGELAHGTSELLTWLLAADGPISLCDQRAWEMVAGNSFIERADGYDWRRVMSDQFSVDLDAEEQRTMFASLRYLNERQLLISHPKKANLVRPAPVLLRLLG